ncbi:AAA family ATPase [Roseobacter denitrificans]|uniref:MoxR-like ATPase n=1 Tax=Roseobacter denitrificans (strain ATCC 33942 / OCh 114) TaxID=375451 RepID=Q16BV3_ROSDO|nr:AAA family ATPase [Roseobacter denitrificans]ABG30540.1 MoxR-like ATPase [Roseobacter denitrificans OCh 114]AVL53689.1 AAA family ATPase [Roseobacter denitrificans]SFF73940.1 MoxR-like ATPase [Roseobacter denitrificans OCh 114]
MDKRPDPSQPGVAALSSYLANGLVGHEILIERLLVALLAGGHLLVEGPPGLAKTRAVKWLSDAVEGSFARIQCTPDLMPSDLTGTPVYKPQDGSFEFVQGPVFNNLVLVDEINRAPPKVQSALLEAMAEHQVTAGNETHALPDPFLVVATQNPIEHDGTFPLPEAQLDRFLLHVVLELPGLETERQILDLVEAEAQSGAPKIQALTLDALADARASVNAVHLAPELRDYIVRLVMATREGPQAQDIEHAVSPRGSLALAAAAKARAFLKGRDYAMPEDVAALAGDALAHRMVLSWRAVADGRKARDVVADVLNAVEPL